MPTKPEIEQHVARLLPTLKETSDAELFRQLGAEYQKAHGQSPESESPENLFQIGQSYFERILNGAKDVLCDA